MPRSTTPAHRIHPPPAGAASNGEGAAKKAKPASANCFPIVGVGASAGGLEALSRFFEQSIGYEGAAYVVVQHQDPSQPGMLPELLQRHTPMPVTVARNRVRVRPGHVYVGPPGKDLSILHGLLHLLEPTARHCPHLPIDNFFRALAADCREHAVGVVLSGMGSDGTLGLRTIKENAGLTLVQDPASAAFAAMPQSAIEAGLADIVIPPELMPTRIEAYFRSTGRCLANGAAARLGRKPLSALETIVILLRERSGNDFSLYKKSMLYRRIERRMALHQLASIADYVHFLQDNDEELDALFSEFLIGVTCFFRDQSTWNALIEKVLPALLASQPDGRTLRAWVPACSTGEEAYSLAIAFRETLARMQPTGQFALQIFASDLDETAVELARSGVYPANIATDVPAQRLAAWFIEDNHGYRVKPEIRDMVIFARQNAISDPPFNHLDILSCRNLLIYLSLDLQRMLLRKFHSALNHHGILILGNTESIGRFGNLFVPVDLQQRIFQSIYPFSEHAQGVDEGTFPIPIFTPPPPWETEPVACQIDLTESEHLVERLRESEQASKEELRSANEELQSTNEELSISKEELLSINMELQVKLAEMSTVTSDLENLLNNSEFSVVILDAELNIRRFTPNAQGLFKLLPVDVGRPLSHIVSDLDSATLLDDAKAVMRTLVVSEKAMRAQDGRQFRVRITPYRDSGQFIKGVIITCTDISAPEAWQARTEALRKTLRKGLENLGAGRDRTARLELLLQTVQHALEAQATEAHDDTRSGPAAAASRASKR